MSIYDLATQATQSSDQPPAQEQQQWDGERFRGSSAPITYIGDGPHPWHLGYLEGQPVTPEHLALQNHLITENPDESLPGRGPVSTAAGESFNSFKNRAVGYWQKLLAQSASQPDRKIGVVTHYRTKRVLDAWMRAGAYPDRSVDADTVATKDAGSKPGMIERLYNDSQAGPQLTSVDRQSPQPLRGGIYIIRHEKTDWNSPTSGNPSQNS